LFGEYLFSARRSGSTPAGKTTSGSGRHYNALVTTGKRLLGSLRLCGCSPANPPSRGKVPMSPLNFRTTTTRWPCYGRQWRSDPTTRPFTLTWALHSFSLDVPTTLVSPSREPWRSSHTTPPHP